ncbi:MAG: hypothetical protein ACRCWO_03680 [Bosea sp. (in: a-proteobacteria)]
MSGNAGLIGGFIGMAIGAVEMLVLNRILASSVRKQALARGADPADAQARLDKMKPWILAANVIVFGLVGYFAGKNLFG